MKKGFTLIELLIVIAIIGILAGVVLVSTSSARNKATASATKQTLSSLKTNLAVCCNDSTATFNEAAGEMCDPAIRVTYPTAADLKLGTGGTVAYEATADCSAADPTVTVAITGHPLAACNGDWILATYAGLTAPTGC